MAEFLYKKTFSSYLVVEVFLLANQLGTQDQHLLLADLQLLTGSIELVEEHLVSGRTRCPGPRGRVAKQALPHLCQVVSQLLVLRLQLLTLRGKTVQRDTGSSKNRLIEMSKWNMSAHVVRDFPVPYLPSGIHTPALLHEPF